MARKGQTEGLQTAGQGVRNCLMKALPLLFATLAVLASNAVAATVKDREAAVRNDRTTMENDARWLYNDVQRGFAQAKRTGKPLLVVLRCVPCLSCSGIDAQVLLQNTEITPLMDQFVCVRVINANALDLSLFQFDFDLSFSTMFFNGDGTVYGRYGSWTHQTNEQNTATAGFKRALEGALAIHRGYPGNKAALAGKQGAATTYKTPVEIPGLSGKYALDLNWSGKVVQSCVHCHQIGDGLRVSYRDQKQPIPVNLIYPMPAPETIGMILAADQVARVESVAAGSIAAKAGLERGDEIVALGQQPLLSIADVSWVLHHSPEAGTLTAVVKRGAAEKSLELVLPARWRSQSNISRRVGTWGMRMMATGGLVLEDLTDGERNQRGLGKSGMGLLVKHVGEYGKHAAAKRAGFQKNDVVVELDGVSSRTTEGELIGHLLQKHLPGHQVTATVLRGGQRVELKLPMQ
jgi:serine protease Do